MSIPLSVIVRALDAMRSASSFNGAIPADVWVELIAAKVLLSVYVDRITKDIPVSMETDQ